MFLLSTAGSRSYRSIWIPSRTSILHLNEPRIWIEHIGKFMGTSLEGNQSMITVYAQRVDLVKKHEALLNELKWSEDSTPRLDLVKAFPCKINC